MILTKDVPDLGGAGQTIEVRNGYGANFLIPRGIAVLATAGNQREMDHHKRRIEAQIVGKELVARVANPRPTDAAATNQDGVGLRNSSERLRLLFGPCASLHLDLSRVGVATAEVRVPA